MTLGHAAQNSNTCDVISNGISGSRSQASQVSQVSLSLGVPFLYFGSNLSQISHLSLGVTFHHIGSNFYHHLLRIGIVMLENCCLYISQVHNSLSSSSGASCGTISGNIGLHGIGGSFLSMSKVSSSVVKL